MKRGTRRAPQPACEMGELLQLLGRPYVLDILHYFLKQSQGPRRFVDIQNALHLSPNTLSERLKALVEAGLFTRTAYNEIPPRVDYALTEKAAGLCPVFDVLDAWSAKNDLKPVVQR